MSTKCSKELWLLNTFERLFRILSHRVVSDRLASRHNRDSGCWGKDIELM